MRDSTLQMLRGLIGKSVVGIRPGPAGYILEFSDGTVLWWRS